MHKHKEGCWPRRRREQANERMLVINEKGLLLGRTVLAKWRGNALELNEHRVRTLLFIAYGKPVAPQVMECIKRAEKAYKRGDAVIALIHLAHTGLHRIDGFDAPLRLFKGEMLLRKGFTAKELLKLAGLAKDDAPDEDDDDDGEDDDSDESGDEPGSSGDGSDFDSKHPRWPAGSPGGIGGEFAPKDEGDATQALHDALTQDAEGSSASTAPAPLDPDKVRAAITSALDGATQLPDGTQVAADDGGMSDASPDTNAILDTWGNPATLNKHVADHASDFGIDSLDSNASYDYAKMANEFLQQAQSQKLPMIEYPNGGEIGAYDPATNTFGVYSADGQTLSFYKPTSPTYFQGQIDRVISGGGDVINPLPNSLLGSPAQISPGKPTPIEVEGRTNTGAMSGGPMRTDDLFTPGHRLPGNLEEPED